MEDKFKKVFNQLLKIAKNSEWQTRHAAENTYCPYCCKEEDEWDDQKEHHKGCYFTKVIKTAEDIKKEL